MPQTQTYSFRAECRLDVDRFLSTLQFSNVSISETNIYSMIDGNFELPDVMVEMTCTDVNVDTLIDIARSLPDAHVLCQTLRPVALAENCLERDTRIAA